MTKNEVRARGPEMKQGTKSIRDWRFGLKARVGTDPNGLVHTQVTTDVGASEFKQLPNLLHGEDRELHGNQDSRRCFAGSLPRSTARAGG